MAVALEGLHSRALISRLKFGSPDVLEAALFNHTLRLLVAVKMTDNDKIKLLLIEKPVDDGLNRFWHQPLTPISLGQHIADLTALKCV